jgi:hypothetical protein
MATEGIHTVKKTDNRGSRTAFYGALLGGNGDLVYSIADFDVVEVGLIPEWVSRFEGPIKRAKMVFLDANLPTKTISYLATLCSEARVPLWFEPTSVPKALRVVSSGALSKLTVISPNSRELAVIATTLDSTPLSQQGGGFEGLSIFLFSALVPLPCFFSFSIFLSSGSIERSNSKGVEGGSWVCSLHPGVRWCALGRAKRGGVIVVLLFYFFFFFST